MWELIAYGTFATFPVLTLWVGNVLGATTSEDALLTYGPLGIMSLMLALFARETVSRLVKDRDRANELRDQMIDDIINRMMPVLQRSVEVLEKRQQLDIELVDTLRDVRRVLETKT